MSILPELDDQLDPEEVFIFDCTPEELAEFIFRDTSDAEIAENTDNKSPDDLNITFCEAMKKRDKGPQM